MGLYIKIELRVSRMGMFTRVVHPLNYDVYFKYIAKYYI